MEHMLGTQTMTRMNRDDAEFMKQVIARETEPLLKRIEALEEKIEWMTETDWAAINRQHKGENEAPSHTRPHRDTP